MTYQSKIKLAEQAWYLKNFKEAIKHYKEALKFKQSGYIFKKDVKNNIRILENNTY
jgi:hypothetical protein